MGENVILDKSFKFSVRIVKLYKYLTSKKNEFVMSKQLLRCGTSIGANTHEAVHGQSEKDFLAKIYIAFKEANETDYWLKLFYESDYLTKIQFESIIKDCNELKKILSSIIMTMKSKMK